MVLEKPENDMQFGNQNLCKDTQPFRFNAKLKKQNLKQRGNEHDLLKQ